MTAKDLNFKEHPFSHCASSDVAFEYDLSLAPKGQKVTLLTVYGIATEGFITGNLKRDADIMAWYPLPGRNRQKEEQLRREGKLPWTKIVTGSR